MMGSMGRQLDMGIVPSIELTMASCTRLCACPRWICALGVQPPGWLVVNFASQHRYAGAVARCVEGTGRRRDGRHCVDGKHSLMVGTLVEMMHVRPCEAVHPWIWTACKWQRELTWK